MDTSMGGVRRVPQRRIREKLDDYMRHRDYDGAGRHLRYWLEEARLGGDGDGELMVLNELIGHSRKVGDGDGARRYGEAALHLIEKLDLAGAGIEGTTCVNFATALNAFADNQRAVQLFERARRVYESDDACDPRLLGGLYNNMALTCAALKRYDEAEALYDAAMAKMGEVQYGALEQAVTCLNRANLIEARDGMEAAEHAIFNLMEQAAALLDTPGIPHDGYYAFVCEKCAPTFEYYGCFADAERFRLEAEAIYAGH